MIIVRTLRRDIAKYNKIDEEVCIVILRRMHSLYGCRPLLQMSVCLSVCLSLSLTPVNPD